MKTLIAFHQEFVTESACFERLEGLRWPEGVYCLHCGHHKVYACNTRYLYKCPSCHKQFTARFGTIFEGSHVPLQKWFLALFLLTLHKRGASTIQLSQHLDVTQKTTWHMVRLIRRALGEAEVAGSAHRLSPLIVADTFEVLLAKIAGFKH